MSDVSRGWADRVRGVIGSRRWAIPLLAILTIAIYLPSLQNGASTDEHYIKRIIANFDREGAALLFDSRYFGISEENSYRPIVTMTYLVDGLLGDTITVSKAQSILWHALTVILCFLLARRLVRRDALTETDPRPFLVALGFACFPMVVEAVDNAGFREDLLATTGVLGALLFGLHARLRWFAPLIFLLGFFSKENAIVAPALLVLCRLYLGRDPEAPPRKVSDHALELGLWLAAVALACWIRFVYLPGTESSPAYPGFSFETSIANIPRLVGFYLWRSIYAFESSALFQHKGVFEWHPFTITNVVHWVILAAVAVVALRSARRGNLIGLGALWFVLALAPTLNVFRQNLWLAERFLYMPSIGFALAAATLVVGRGGRAHGWRTLAMVAVIGMWATLTVRHHPAWRDDDAVDRTALAENPTDCFAMSRWTTRLAEAQDFAGCVRVGAPGVAVCRPFTRHEYMWNYLGPNIGYTVSYCRQQLGEPPPSAGGWKVKDASPGARAP